MKAPGLQARRAGPEAIARGSRVGEGYARVRELIVDGRLAPGALLTESSLADLLGMSRTPLHSALQRLEQEGYLRQLSPGSSRRLMVAPLTRPDADELVAILARLEGLAARWLAGLPRAQRRAATARLCAVNRALSRCSELPAARQRDRILQLDVRFHRTVVRSAKRPRLLSFHQALEPQWERYVRLYLSTLTNALPAFVAHHNALITAIEEGDARAAAAAIRADWVQASRRLTAVIDTVGERGTWQ